MKCPQCNSDLKLRNPVEYNVYTYGNTVLASTLCCGKPVEVRLHKSLSYSAVTTNKYDDDWGHEFTQDIIN